MRGGEEGATEGAAKEGVYRVGACDGGAGGGRVGYSEAERL